MSTHYTPGPWATTANGFNVVSTTAKVHVCATKLREDAEQKANALLIAAAPDMLAALVEYDASMTAYWGEPEAVEAKYDDAIRCWNATRAAIAKARGA